MRLKKLLRTISSVVLVTFTCFCLDPAIAALTRPSLPDQKSIVAQQTVESRYAAILMKIEDLAKRANAKRSQGRNATLEMDAIISHSAELTSLEPQIESGFAGVDSRLTALNVPQSIKQRHRDATASYRGAQTAFASLTRNLTQSHQRNSDADRDQALSAISAFFASHRQGRAHVRSDPNNLPWRPVKASVRPALTEAGALASALRGNRGKGASLEKSLKAAPAAPSAEDVAETEDVQLTQAVRDMAATLHNDPVEMINWVRNNTEFLPTYGSIQGSDATLLLRRGNAFDLTTLLVALYRAAGIPIRYVYGTVEISAQQAMNWVGGVGTPQAAISLLQQGGIPTTAIISGGTIQRIQLEHVWAEAFIDFVPSRGAKEHARSTWVPLDASYKQYSYQPGLGLRTAVPIDGQAFVDNALAGATINETQGFIVGIDPTRGQTQLNSYANQLASYVSSQNPGASLGDAIGNRAVNKSNSKLLSGSLPFKVVQRTPAVSALPDAARWSLKLSLFNESNGAAGNSVLLEFVRSTPQVSGKRLGFKYDPATQDDKDVLDAASSAGDTAFAAYLVSFTPRITLDGIVIAAGQQYLAGTRQVLRVDVVAPFDSWTSDYAITSGDVSALTFNPSGVSAGLFEARTGGQRFESTPTAEWAVEAMNQIGLTWWANKLAMEHVVANSASVVSYHLPSHALVSTRLSVDYLFGVARTAQYKSRNIDGKLDLFMLEHVAADADKKTRYLKSAGVIGSYLEGAVFDQLYIHGAPFGISTMSLLKKAISDNVPIYVVTKDNVDSALAQIETTQDVADEIRNAVNAQKHVIIPSADVAYFGYQGTGYIVEDPLTGASAYLIDGGFNGGAGPAPEAVYPIPQIPITPTTAFMLKGALDLAGGKLVVENGMLIGIGFVAPPPPTATGTGTSIAVRTAAIDAGLLLAAIAAVLIVVTTAIDHTFPLREVPFAVSKYSTASGAFRNYMTRLIRATPDGTFGAGVYVGLYRDPTLGSISCPPTGGQPQALANAYELNGAGNNPADPRKAEAYVFFDITRDGIYKIALNPNPRTGATEVVITSPLVPGAVFEDGFDRLYIGPGAPGIAGVDLCQ